VDKQKVTAVKLNIEDKNALLTLMKQGFEVVMEFLPPEFMKLVAETAIEAGVSLVNTNYSYAIASLNENAIKSGITIMPECGYDPGLDLVLYNYGVKLFDEIHVLNSYCGGFPEKEACTNPLKYKISWNWSAVLKSLNRDAVVIKDGKTQNITGKDQHDNSFIHHIDFPNLGKLEASPNGNAVNFTDTLGVTKTIKETGRYSLRWPGWSDF